MFEKIIFDSFYEQIKNSLSDNQFGFEKIIFDSLYEQIKNSLSDN